MIGCPNFMRKNILEVMMKAKIHTIYRTQDGQKVPGVTTIIGILAKPALIHWSWKLGTQGIDYRKFRDEKANVGKLAHLMIMDYLKGDKTDTSEYSQKEIEQAENSMLSFLEWEKGHKLEPILIEEPLVSEHYKYGGTPDFIGNLHKGINGMGCIDIIDFKTGSGIYDEYIIQLSAYKHLFMETNIDILGEGIIKTRILRIPRSKDEAFEERLVSERELEIGWEIFKHCLQIYTLRKQWKAK